MARMRTIKDAYAAIKQSDPETCLTLYALRCKVISGEIPSVKAGRKYLINIDLLDEYLNSPCAPVESIGRIRPVSAR